VSEVSSTRLGILPRLSALGATFNHHVSPPKNGKCKIGDLHFSVVIGIVGISATDLTIPAGSVGTVGLTGLTGLRILRILFYAITLCITDFPPQRPPRLNDHLICTKTHQNPQNHTSHNSTKTGHFTFKLKTLIDLKVLYNIVHLYLSI